MTAQFDNFKKDFDLRYEDILNKVLVGKVIANTRFEPKMRYGDLLTRFTLDLSGVRVRTISDYADRTLDRAVDSTETMSINIKKGLSFPLAHSEEVQAGPLNPGMEVGKQIAMKAAQYLDAQILAETKNAASAFDTGNLTTASANGTPITLSSTTVPQMVSMTHAKLFSTNADMTNLCWVLDPFSLAQIAQYPIGKDITSENTVFKNGFNGNIFGAEVYVTNNLTGEATLVFTGNAVNAETVTIGGVTFTGVTTIGSTAGNYLVSASDSTTAVTNLAGLLNDPATTSSTQVALSAANQIIITDILGLTATATSATVLTIVCKGSSRLTLSETQTNATWATNFVHAYYGQKGAIDVAVQEKPELWSRDEPKQRTTNYFVDIVAAVKTFADGAVKFLDVKIANA